MLASKRMRFLKVITREFQLTFVPEKPSISSTLVQQTPPVNTRTSALVILVSTYRVPATNFRSSLQATEQISFGQPSESVI